MTILALLSHVATFVWRLGIALRELASTTRSHARELVASASTSASASASASRHA